MRRHIFLGLALVMCCAPGELRAMVAITGGASVDVSSSDRWQWFGEASVLRVWETFGLGGVIGTSLRVHYLELEPIYWGPMSARSVVFGVNPGVVLDRSGTDGRVGVQATAWIWPRIAVGDAAFAPLPIGFVRSELYSSQHEWSAGIMLKLPLKVWW